MQGVQVINTLFNGTALAHKILGVLWWPKSSVPKTCKDKQSQLVLVGQDGLKTDSKKTYWRAILSNYHNEGSKKKNPASILLGLEAIQIPLGRERNIFAPISQSLI